MKKLLLITIFTISLMANEPNSAGAFYGNYKFSMQNAIINTGHYTNAMGINYLQRNNKNFPNAIHEMKRLHINNMLNDAKKLAKKYTLKYYAIDNIQHTVSQFDGTLIVSTDCNILVFK